MQGERPIDPSRGRGSRGFTLVELMIAILLLLVGIVAVADLIPRAMERNFLNRYDSTALILAQRHLEQMTVQATSVFSYTATRPDGTTFTCNLGINDPANAANNPAGVTNGAGAQLISGPATGNTLMIDWTQPGADVPAGYRDVWTNAQGYRYELRWNVMTLYNTIGGVVQPVGKRIVISGRAQTQAFAQPPATLITLVGR